MEHLASGVLTGVAVTVNVGILESSLTFPVGRVEVSIQSCFLSSGLCLATQLYTNEPRVLSCNLFYGISAPVKCRGFLTNATVNHLNPKPQGLEFQPKSPKP